MEKLRVKRRKKIYQENSNQRRANIAVATSQKIDFKTEKVTI